MRSLFMQVLCICCITYQNYAQNVPSVEIPKGTGEAVIQPRLFGAKSTTTYTNVVLATLAVYSSCIRTVKPVVCAGRRLRRSTNLEWKNEGFTGRRGHGLESSELKDIDNYSETNRRGNFLGITVWTTAVTTTTVTIKSTNTATTLSLTYNCIGGNAIYPKYSCLVG